MMIMKMLGNFIHLMKQLVQKGRSLQGISLSLFSCNLIKLVFKCRMRKYIETGKYSDLFILRCPKKGSLERVLELSCKVWR